MKPLEALKSSVATHAESTSIDALRMPLKAHTSAVRIWNTGIGLIMLMNFTLSTLP